ncbi:MAG: hypothetical protein ACK5TR_00430 [Alphaproteobacteria bacterium]|jgi:hypothetical protein|nr:hypothetical protein [Alphaproteobacteria bacterium]
MKAHWLLFLTMGCTVATPAHSSEREEDEGKKSPAVNPYHDPDFLMHRYMQRKPNNKPSSGKSLETLERKAEEHKSYQKHKHPGKDAASPSQDRTATQDSL